MPRRLFCFEAQRRCGLLDVSRLRFNYSESFREQGGVPGSSEVGRRRAARKRATSGSRCCRGRAQCFSHIVERGFEPVQIQRFWQDGDRARCGGVVRR